ncbi:hypothetical protein [Thiosocius teredinicola]|uniref:hypothetical protein n=1 Tax=Thiosocius teredinicola TaxID=1973002 RepID=UPI000990AF6E
MDIKVIAVVVTILLAITGYLYNYSQNLLSERRKERLNLLNRQLNDFYGPLYILTQSSRASLVTLRQRLGGVQVFKDAKQPTDAELDEWRVWVKAVLMPINEKIETVIVNNAHLIRESEMPRCLLTFMSHMSSYRAIVSKWDAGDFSEFLSPIEFPKDLHQYAEQSYQAIKNEQVKLLGSRNGTQ